MRHIHPKGAARQERSSRSSACESAAFGPQAGNMLRPGQNFPPRARKVVRREQKVSGAQPERFGTKPELCGAEPETSGSAARTFWQRAGKFRLGKAESSDGVGRNFCQGGRKHLDYTCGNLRAGQYSIRATTTEGPSYYK